MSRNAAQLTHVHQKPPFCSNGPPHSLRFDSWFGSNLRTDFKKKKNKTNYHPGFLCLVTRTKFYGRKISWSALRVLRVFKKGFSSIAQIYICTFIFRFTAIYRALSIHWLEGGQSPGCVWLSKCWATTVTWQLVTNDKEKKKVLCPVLPRTQNLLNQTCQFNFHRNWFSHFLLTANVAATAALIARQVAKWSDSGCYKPKICHLSNILVSCLSVWLTCWRQNKMFFFLFQRLVSKHVHSQLALVRWKTGLILFLLICGYKLLNLEYPAFQ